MNNRPIALHDRGGIGWITMDDGKVNAIDGPFLEAFEAALDEAESRPAVVLTGRPGQFSAGLNLRTLPDLEESELRTTLERFDRLLRRLALFPRPVLAAIDGHAIAGGCVLALCADYRLATRSNIKIGLSEAAIGIILPRVVVELARLTIPPRAAIEVMAWGRLYGPDGAREVGLVDEVIEGERFEDRVRELAAELAHLPQASYAETKRRVRRILDDLDETDMGAELAQSLRIPSHIRR